MDIIQFSAAKLQRKSETTKPFNSFYDSDSQKEEKTTMISYSNLLPSGSNRSNDSIESGFPASSDAGQHQVRW